MRATMTGWAADQHPSPTLDSFWRSLFFFSVYRVSVALLFLGAVVFFGDAVSLGVQSPTFFRRLALAYLGFSIVFLVVQPRYRRHFDSQLTAQVVVDVVVLTLMMFASGGQKSGIAMLLLVVVSGAGLVGQGRMVLFYAALASLAVLLEESWWALMIDSSPADFFTAGITALAFFAAGIAARLLAKRVVSNELLAIDRGHQLDAQLRMSEQIIREMDSGVLQVSSEGVIQMSNPKARVMLGLSDQNLPATLPSVLAAHFAQWQTVQAEISVLLFWEHSQRQLLVRYIP
jgi:two-component system sensor histidine kinase PilS (NtrC family)